LRFEYVAGWNRNWSGRFVQETPAAAAAAAAATNMKMKASNNNNNNNNNIICDNEKGTCMVIDVAISGDRNVIKNEAEKILKY
jgi:PBP1b-binding outer membrane lipoprotein LpoB